MTTNYLHAAKLLAARVRREDAARGASYLYSQAAIRAMDAAWTRHGLRITDALFTLDDGRAHRLADTMLIRHDYQ